MHPTLFEYWSRIESALVQQRAEMAAAAKEARLDSARGRSSRSVRMWGTVGSGWRRVRRSPARALAFGEPDAGRLRSPIAVAALFGKEG
jgi:hypothetical protein